MRISTKSKLKNDLVVYQVVAMAFLILALALGIAMEHSNEAKNWTKVNATIYKMTTMEKRHKNGVSWILSIYLKYSLNDKNGVYIDRSTSARTKEKVEKLADKYSYGDKIMIYVNPENPIECVMNPYIDSERDKMGVVLCVLVSLVLLVIYLIKRAQYKRLN